MSKIRAAHSAGGVVNRNQHVGLCVRERVRVRVRFFVVEMEEKNKKKVEKFFFFNLSIPRVLWLDACLRVFPRRARCASSGG